jgi:hypothetical protein
MYLLPSIRLLLPGSLLLSGALLLACGPSAHTPGDQSYAASVAPGTRAPADKLEEAILSRLADLAPEQATPIEGQSVSAGKVYTAASGRQCRRVNISGPQARTSLACLMPQGWSFVPVVFVEEPTGT